jgi:NAD+ kinase
MSQFSTIGLISRRDNRDIVDTLLTLVSFLLKRQLTLVVDESVAGLLGTHQFAVVPREEIGQHCQLVIVVGGDGSMLKAANALAEQDIPVVGINRGRLGFLTDILPDDIEHALGQILDGQYRSESRFLLEVSTNNVKGDNDKGELLLGAAMNDIVLHPGIAAQMIEFELYVDGQFVCHQASDGLIIATPTGSTAYSLSAGGPIMHPRLDVLVLVPMYPHSLSSRPIVVDSNSSIALVIGERHNTAPQISCDGTVVHTSSVGDTFTIRRKAKQLRLVHPIDYDYYATCRSKLGWAQRPVRG